MLYASHWENRLLDLARQAQEQPIPENPHAFEDKQLLEAAYAFCDQVTQEHSKTFYMASQLLPHDTRRSVRALYAYCRVSDDLVDRGSGEIRAALAAWRDYTLHPVHLHRKDGHPLEEKELVALAWEDTRIQRGVPLLYAEQLLQGVASDLEKKRYANFNELAEYCYAVACTVGLMSMHIVGYTSEEAIPYAIRLGVALQMTNILRDVGEDWRAGRLYLPLDEMECFGLTEADVEKGQVDDRWREFMRFQIARNRILYAESMPGVKLLARQGRFAIAAAGELYRGILDQIEANDYDVFTHRASVSSWGKLRRLPGIWYRAASGTYPAYKSHPF